MGQMLNWKDVETSVHTVTLSLAEVLSASHSFVLSSPPHLLTVGGRNKLALFCLCGGGGRRDGKQNLVKVSLATDIASKYKM